MDVVNRLRANWDRTAAVACTVLGLVVLLLGWRGVSGTSFTTEQLPYVVSGGLGALFLLGVGGVLWLSADLRDEWRKLDALERAIRERTPEPVEVVEEPAPVPAPRPRRTSKTAAQARVS